MLRFCLANKTKRKRKKRVNSIFQCVIIVIEHKLREEGSKQMIGMWGIKMR